MDNDPPWFPYLPELLLLLCSVRCCAQKNIGEATGVEKPRSVQGAHQLHRFQSLPGLLDRLFPPLAARVLGRHVVINFKGLPPSSVVTPSLLDAGTHCQNGCRFLQLLTHFFSHCVMWSREGGSPSQQNS